MKVAIRTDASTNIGSGHVMRTLCLADALKLRGGRVRFLCRNLPPHLAQLVTEQGHEIVALPNIYLPPQPAESAWSDDLRAQDIHDVAIALEDWERCDWLIVDHYAASSAWENSARHFTRRLMAIDDLGRSHNCDVLLDANFYLAGSSPYANLLPPTCQTLFGPTHALLRPEFLAARASARVRDGKAQRLLVCMGGIDSDNATGTVINALMRIDPKDRPEAIDVVIGSAHPAHRDISSACAFLGAALYVQTSNMAGLCVAADLAVGAGGSATWERCAVGLPTLSLCLAENQRNILHHGSRAGLFYAPDADFRDSELVAVHLYALLTNPGLRNHLSRNAMAAVDGLGASRTTDVLFQI